MFLGGLVRFIIYISQHTLRESVYSLIPLREKCSCLEFFWFVFSRIRTEYVEILRIPPYSIQMRENTDQKNSEYGHFLCSVQLTAMEDSIQTNMQNLY